MRVSIFSEPNGRDKDKAVRVQGVLTRQGMACFESARTRLRTLYKRVTGAPPAVVSDADTIEFMARGPEDSRDYLERLHR